MNPKIPEFLSSDHGPVANLFMVQQITRYRLKAHRKPHVCEFKYTCARSSVEQTHVYDQDALRIASDLLSNCPLFDCTPVPQR